VKGTLASADLLFLFSLTQKAEPPLSFVGVDRVAHVGMHHAHLHIHSTSVERLIFQNKIAD
jgi:hypothetical protein